MPDNIWRMPYTAEKIQEAIGKGPVIQQSGDSNTWWIWDIRAGQYVDTGVVAKGQKGDIGPQGDVGPRGPQGVQGPQGEIGVSIVKIERTSGNGAAGTADTYTITMSDGSKSTFNVWNGADGEGAGDMLKSVYDPQNKAQDVFAYVDRKVGDIPTSDVSEQIGAHNTSGTAHQDIRTVLNGKAPATHTHTPSSIGAAAANHTHSASEITSGTFPVARGGTGATTADAARTNLGIDSAIAAAMAGGAKIQTGSYVGTGTYGSLNPCSLTFDFEPKLLHIQESEASKTTYSFFWMGGPYALNYYYTTYENIVSVTESGNQTTISWYCTNEDYKAAQCNGSGKSYTYIAIG